MGSGTSRHSKEGAKPTATTSPPNQSEFIAVKSTLQLSRAGNFDMMMVDQTYAQNMQHLDATGRNVILIFGEPSLPAEHSITKA
jgi:hypothetical protein